MQAYCLFFIIFCQKLSNNENKQRLYKIQKRPTSLFYHVLLIKQNECMYLVRRQMPSFWVFLHTFSKSFRLEIILGRFVVGIFNYFPRIFKYFVQLFFRPTLKVKIWSFVCLAEILKSEVQILNSQFFFYLFWQLAAFFLSNLQLKLRISWCENKPGIVSMGIKV